MGRRSHRVIHAAACVVLLSVGQAAAAQELDIPFIDAPPAPVAPATVNRDSDGRATMRAVRVAEPLVVDGRLDEQVYRTVPPVGDFIQQVPDEGMPATEPTEVWVLFDDVNLYISMMCYETNPERRVASERRRDSQELTNSDNIMLSIDTFYDRRNAFNFQINAVGGFRDQLVTDGSANRNWNTVLDVQVDQRAEGGYSFELVVPFRSLRYRGSGPQVWGINFRRTVQWKNEVSYVNPVPASYGRPGINQLSTAATLVGVETSANSLNLEMKPYVISSANTNRVGSSSSETDGDVNAGFDFKYGLTRGLTADLTVNTDFAQVEEDVQQVSLTRFSLFFPEKRDFFLEGQGLFGFAGQGTGGRLDGASDVPTLFFSRRIGLSRGRSFP